MVDYNTLIPSIEAPIPHVTQMNMPFSLYRSILYCYMYCLVTQSCPSLWQPCKCSLPGSSVHGISQAKLLEWVAISFSRGSSQPRDQTWVSCTAGRFFTIWATREAHWQSTIYPLASETRHIFFFHTTKRLCSLPPAYTIASLRKKQSKTNFV